ncbi:hypothetical protein [Polaribacter sp. HL-MS24]|uniref:hypothetical protein n=1 Tax=Polaribacter sp. HL-MS24 TaxID=3077735 RepID=UPI0029346DE2|nr:hypothetical protein [Polaribacter sp. HL-MS24]WOC41049.1 hypothetical protein RRF69_04635 [Polaribacter sp. HL-MS24]
MGVYTFKLTNTETGSITEVTAASIQTILKAIASFRKQENEQPIQYMRSGKRIRQVKGLHSKEEEMHQEIIKEIIK